MSELIKLKHDKSGEYFWICADQIVGVKKLSGHYGYRLMAGAYGSEVESTLSKKAAQDLLKKLNIKGFN